MKYHLSQIFLSNNYLIKKISNLIYPLLNSNILEIGSGNGNLSFHIFNNYKLYNIKIYLIEIDKKFCYNLKKYLKNIFIINKNILKFDLNLINKNKYKLHIIGNLPYKITCKIFFYLLNYINIIIDQFLMVQKEFFLKLKFFNKNFNFFNIYFNSFYKINNLINITNRFFTPKPNIDSCFIKLKPLYLSIVDFKYLKKFKIFLKLFFKNKKKIILLNKIKFNINYIILIFYNTLKI